MQIVDKLSMLRSKHNGIIQNMVTTTIVNVLNESDGFKLNNLAMICGPKSPTTTKYVIHVPIR